MTTPNDEAVNAARRMTVREFLEAFVALDDCEAHIEDAFERLLPHARALLSSPAPASLRQTIMSWLDAEALKPHPYSDAAVDELVAALAVRGEREILEKAARRVIDERMSSVTDHEGRQHGMEDDRGEKLWLVPFEVLEELALALPTEDGKKG